MNSNISPEKILKIWNTSHEEKVYNIAKPLDLDERFVKDIFKSYSILINEPNPKKSISEICSFLERKINKIEWWERIPISINSAFGDALTNSQIDNTCEKINELSEHKAPYGFCTKAVPSDEILEKLSKVIVTPNLVVRYSLTGLNEGNYSFEERIETINRLKQIFGHVIIITRPIIWGRNTDKNTLEKLVKVAQNTSGLLITGALHDSTKRKQVDIDVKKTLVNLCKEYNVKYFHKSSCAAAYVTNNNCWVHNLSLPNNLYVLDKLGYKYELFENKIVLENGTVGDLNFLRMVTNSYVYCKNLINGYNLLSFSDQECKFDVTSSWYSWSQNIPCEINCDYCIIKDIEYLNNNCYIGVNPCEIEKYAINSKRNIVKSKWQKGKYHIIDKKELIGYNNIRTIQECMTDKYNR